GGVMAELIGDAQFRLAPLTDVDADELVSTGKAGRLVAGYRGAPASDAAALADLLLPLSQLADRHPEIPELHLNPVGRLADGGHAVGGRIGVRRAEPRLSSKPW